MSANAFLSKIFETAKKWGYHSGPNPAAGVELPEKKPVREEHILELGEIPGLLNALREPVRTMVRLALLTGLRIGEILALDWTSVDLAAGSIRVTRVTIAGAMGTPKTKSLQTLCAIAGIAEREAPEPSRPSFNSPKNSFFIRATAHPSRTPICFIGI